MNDLIVSDARELERSRSLPSFAGLQDSAAILAYDDAECIPLTLDQSPVYLCSVEQAARIVGQKWTLQIVNVLIDFKESRFCELQDALGGVNPGTLSARLKMLEEEGIISRSMVSAAPPHVTYRLTPMGNELSGVIRELTNWSRVWLCDPAQSPSAPARSAL